MATSSSSTRRDDSGTFEGQRRRKLEAQLREEELKAAIAKAKGSGASTGTPSGASSGSTSQDQDRDKEREFQLLRDREARQAQREMGDERLKADRILAADRAAEIIAQRREASSRSRQVMQALSRSR